MDKIIKNESYRYYNDDYSGDLNIDVYENYSIIENQYLLKYDWANQKFKIYNLDSTDLFIYPCYNLVEMVKFLSEKDDLTFKTNLFCNINSAYDSIAQDIEIKNNTLKIESLDLNNYELFFKNKYNEIFKIKSVEILKPQLVLCDNYNNSFSKYLVDLIYPVKIDYYNIKNKIVTEKVKWSNIIKRDKNDLDSINKLNELIKLEQDDLKFRENSYKKEKKNEAKINDMILKLKKEHIIW